MLEAERAGAKALVVYMGSFERNSEPWKTLRQIQADEAHNCAVNGKRDRLVFLVRGLKWAVKRFEEELPRLDADASALFTRMRDSHLRSIAACEKLAREL